MILSRVFASRQLRQRVGQSILLAGLLRLPRIALLGHR
jgi:hypothetical protein